MFRACFGWQSIGRRCDGIRVSFSLNLAFEACIDPFRLLRGTIYSFDTFLFSQNPCFYSSTGGHNHQREFRSSRRRSPMTIETTTWIVAMIQKEVLVTSFRNSSRHPPMDTLQWLRRGCTSFGWNRWRHFSLFERGRMHVQQALCWHESHNKSLFEYGRIFPSIVHYPTLHHLPLRLCPARSRSNDILPRLSAARATETRRHSLRYLLPTPNMLLLLLNNVFKASGIIALPSAVLYKTFCCNYGDWGRLESDWRC